jgi:hypothetical protein
MTGAPWVLECPVKHEHPVHGQNTIGAFPRIILLAKRFIAQAGESNFSRCIKTDYAAVKRSS